MSATAIPAWRAVLQAPIAVVTRGGLCTSTYRAVAAEAGVSRRLVRDHSAPASSSSRARLTVP